MTLLCDSLSYKMLEYRTSLCSLLIILVIFHFFNTKINGKLHADSRHAKLDSSKGKDD